MADPQLPGGVRVQAIFQGVSGLPEDRYVNTFAFVSNASGTNAGKAACIAKVRDFYQVVHSGSPNKVTDYMGGPLIDEATSEFRAYAMIDDIPRVPYIEPWAPVGSPAPLSSANPIPSEVALCLSYYAGANQPGRRGRIYIGPLNTSALAPVDQAPSAPNQNFINALASAGAALQNLSTLDAIWCVLGRHGSGTLSLEGVTAGWVDNAWDTQRRRGEAASARVNW